jgi:hypothetical protein
MSVSASGTFAKTLVFSTWKGRPYVRERVIPSNPRSEKQTGIRGLFGFIAQAWYTLSTPNKATWDTLATGKEISPFNAYQAENLMNWQQTKPPSEAYPAARAGTAVVETTMGLTGGVGSVTVVLTPSAATNLWGHIIWRSATTIVTPTWENVIAVIPADGANAVTYTDTPLAAQVWHYRSAVFTVDGSLGTVKADATGTAT